MSKKPMSFDQWAEFCGKVMYALPRDMDSATVQGWIDNADGLAAMLHANLIGTADETVVPTVPQYPPNGVEFGLTIPAPFTGLEMVHRFGYDSTGWQFNGQEIVVPQTKRFKLVQIGYQLNWEAVKIALAPYGITQGQWLRAFKEAYPYHDGHSSSIGVADNSWVNPDGGARFPCVCSDGAMFFYWTGYDFDADWRWLVEVQA